MKAKHYNVDWVFGFHQYEYDLFWFYGTSIIVDYLMPNLFLYI